MDGFEGVFVRYADDGVRHEALFERVEIKGLHRHPVAAGSLKLGPARGWRCSRGREAVPTTTGRAGASHDGPALALDNLAPTDLGAQLTD